MRSIRVYLVDDHLALREGIRRLLGSDEGIEVVGEAGSAEECLKEITARSVDLVMMDINLPGMNGIQATRHLKEKYPDLKVLVLSTFGEEYTVQALEAGANGYLLKTASQSELLNAVLQAARGQTPIDAELTSTLVDSITGKVDRDGPQVLTDRQTEILRLIADGVPSKEIQEKLSISQPTLTRQIRRIFDQLEVEDRAHAVSEAYKRHIL